MKINIFLSKCNSCINVIHDSCIVSLRYMVVNTFFHIPIGFNRYYETMVFESLYDKYNDANIKHEIDIWTECGIYGETWQDACNNYDNNLDIEANMMHDKVVKEMCARISKLKDIKDNGELFREEND